MAISTQTPLRALPQGRGPAAQNQTSPSLPMKRKRAQCVAFDSDVKVIPPGDSPERPPKVIRHNASPNFQTPGAQARRTPSTATQKHRSPLSNKKKRPSAFSTRDENARPDWNLTEAEYPPPIPTHDDLRRTIRKRDAEIARLRTLLEANKDESGTLEDSAREWERRYDECAEEKEALEEKLDVLESTVTEVTAERDELRETRASLILETSGLKVEVEELEEDFEYLSEHLAEAISQEQIYRNTIKHMGRGEQRRLEDLRKTHLAAEARLRSEIGVLKTKLGERTESVVQMEHSTASMAQ